jgi:phosphoribosyl-ATP pyrophosphohydrolase
MSFTLADLEARISARASASPDESWTARLLAEGPPRCAKKFGEEAVELVIAVVEGDESPIVSEAADVLYHLAVALRSRNVAFDAVMAELQRRTGRSGLDEKAAREE